jgi:hypothetical protein
MNQLDRVTKLEEEVAALSAALGALRQRAPVKPARQRLFRPLHAAALATAGAIASVPIVGWTSVAITEFAAETPISAAEVNGNFSALNGAVDGTFTLGTQAIDDFIQGCDPCVINNAAVEISTSGGLVWVGLVTDPDDDAGVEAGVRGYGGGTAMTLLFYLERSSDGGLTWEERGVVESVSGDSGSVQVPPSSVLFLDRAAPGDWQYRLLMRFSGSATQADFSGLRLYAREIAGS